MSRVYFQMNILDVPQKFKDLQNMLKKHVNQYFSFFFVFFFVDIMLFVGDII